MGNVTSGECKQENSLPQTMMRNERYDGALVWSDLKVSRVILK